MWEVQRYVVKWGLFNSPKNCFKIVDSTALFMSLFSDFFSLNLKRNRNSELEQMKTRKPDADKLIYLACSAVMPDVRIKLYVWTSE